MTDKLQNIVTVTLKTDFMCLSDIVLFRQIFKVHNTKLTSLTENQNSI